MRDALEKLVTKFNHRAETDDKLRNDLAGIERKVMLDLGNRTQFHFVLKNAHVDGVNDGPVDSPDIMIITDEGTLESLIKREIGPMKAIALRKLKVKASIEDMLRLRKFF